MPIVCRLKLVDGVQGTASGQSQAEAPGSDVVHASKRPAPGTADEDNRVGDGEEEEGEEEEEEDWTEHMGEADALHGHAEGSTWAVMWLAGQDALDMEAASDAEVAHGISQVGQPALRTHPFLLPGTSSKV